MSSHAASAIGRSRTPAKERVGELLDQQETLRELAVAVAEMRAPEVIYELVAREAAKVAGVDSGAVVRFRVDGVAEVVGSWRMPGSQVGSLLPLEGAEGVAIVARTGHSVRTNGSKPSNGLPISVSLPGVAVPIRVRRELWGSVLVVVRLLETGARAGDVLGRIGGDEFALLLPETLAEGALTIAERWAAEFRAAPVGVASHLTMSAGVCDLT